MASRASLKTLIDTNLGISSGIVTKVKHKEVDDAIVDSCKPYIAGWFTLGDIAGTTGLLSSYGVASATAATGSPSNTSKVTIVFSTAMPSNNYYVRMFSRGISSSTQYNDCSAVLMFANPTTAQVDIWIRESFGTAQNVQVYFEIIPID